MEIRKGDVVRVSLWNGESVVGRVDRIMDDVKNDRPGIDYTITSTGAAHWAYTDQVIENLSRNPRSAYYREV